MNLSMTAVKYEMDKWVDKGFKFVYEKVNWIVKFVLGCIVYIIYYLYYLSVLDF